MTADPTTHAIHKTAPFARLVKELTDLDYEPTFTDNPDRTTYTATDGRLTVTVDNTASPACADLTKPNGHDDPEWTVTLTATTPDRIQLMVLYAALNGDAADHATAVDALAAALGVDRDQRDQQTTTTTAG